MSHLMRKAYLGILITIIICSISGSCTTLPQLPGRSIVAIIGYHYFNTNEEIAEVADGDRRVVVQVQLTDSQFHEVFRVADSLGLWAWPDTIERYSRGSLDPDVGFQFIELRSGERFKRIEWEGHTSILHPDGKALETLSRAIMGAYEEHEQVRHLPKIIKW